MNVDFGRSVTYAFEDKLWTSKLIVFLIAGFIPGLNVILWGGYAISIARNIFRNEATPLPGWDGWSDIAVRGLLSIMGTLLYFGPLILVGGCLMLTSLVLRSESAVMSLRCGLLVFGLIYTLVMIYVLGSAHLRFAETDQFRSYLDVGERLRDVRIARAVFGPLFLYQGLISFLALVLVLVASVLAIVVLTAIATQGGILGILLAVVLGVGALFMVSMLTLAFLANGYVLGAACVSIETEFTHE